MGRLTHSNNSDGKGDYSCLLGVNRNVAQWGEASTKTGRSPVKFPLTFPNSVYAVTAQANYTTLGISAPDLNGFRTTINGDAGDAVLWWIAIGN